MPSTIDFRDQIQPGNAKEILDADGIISGLIINGQIEIRHPQRNLYTLNNCKLNSLQICNIQKEMSLQIENCEIRRLFIDEQSKIKSIKITQASQIETFYVNKEVACNELVLEDQSEIISGTMLHVPTETEFRGGSKLGVLKFNSSVKGGKIYFFNAVASHIDFHQCKIEKLTIQKSDLSSLRCSRSTIAEIKMTDFSSCKEFSFNEGHSEHLNFFELSKFKETDISISNSVIENLSLIDYYNKGKFKFINCAVGQSIQITNSELSNGVFNGVDWPKADINFNRSHISKCNFFNIAWPDNYRISEIKELKTKENEDILWETMESYRQLKSAYQNQQNFIEAAKFRYNELRLYYQLMHHYTWYGFDLRRFGNWWKYERKNWWEHLGEYLILWTSKKGSNFGESVGLPLYQMIKFHLILFTLLLLNIDGLPVKIVSPLEHNWEKFWEGFRIFIFTINPAHSFIIGDIPIYGAIDTLMRISSGYFIYYFLKASRKFHIS